MDIMSAKLEAGMYKERFGFEADFRLMIRNAKTYNMPGTFAYSESLALESVFDKSIFPSVRRRVKALMEHWQNCCLGQEYDCCCDVNGHMDDRHRMPYSW
jgi:hypothetical protein